MVYAVLCRNNALLGVDYIRIILHVKLSTTVCAIKYRSVLIDNRLCGGCILYSGFDLTLARERLNLMVEST